MPDESSTLAEILTLWSLRILAAIAIAGIGWWLARKLTNIYRFVLGKRQVDAAVVSFTAAVLQGLLIGMVIISALSQLGVPTAPLIAAAGAAGLAIGLALQGSLSNLAAGIMLLVFRPFRVGDFVSIGGVAGSVIDVGILFTELNSPDNKKLVVPNSQIMGDAITNFSAHATRRMDLVFGVSYQDDIPTVQKILLDILKGDERVLTDPAPTVEVLEYADSSVNFAVRPWVKTSEYWDLYWHIHKTVKQRFDEEGISIPFPQRDLHVIQGGQQPIAS